MTDAPIIDPGALIELQCVLRALAPAAPVALLWARRCDAECARSQAAWMKATMRIASPQRGQIKGRHS
jgi:hypothetical protein